MPRPMTPDGGRTVVSPAVSVVSVGQIDVTTVVTSIGAGAMGLDEQATNHNPLPKLHLTVCPDT